MSDPVAWDGEGVDPWLPHRLEAVVDAAEAESEARETYWVMLTAWLAGVRAAMDRSGPDPVTVRAYAPAWVDAVHDWTATTIAGISETAYRRLTGDAYTVDQRQAAAVRAWARANTMVAVPDEVYVLIQREVAIAIRDGRSIDWLAERIDTTLDATATPRWSNRATVTARTEGIGAVNAGRADGQATIAARLGGPFERLWISTRDTRTRPSHRVADGQRADLDGTFSVGLSRLRWPGDPLGPAAEVIQCRCTSALVRPGTFTDVARRRA